MYNLLIGIGYKREINETKCINAMHLDIIYIIQINFIQNTESIEEKYNRTFINNIMSSVQKKSIKIMIIKCVLVHIRLQNTRAGMEEHTPVT